MFNRQQSLGGKKMKKIVYLVLLGLTLNFKTEILYAASTTANSLITIIQQISIVQVRDLQFAQKVQGGASETVAPADGSSAEFTVTGEANTAFTVNLPGSISMITGDGVGATKNITVNSFAHNLGGSPSLDGDGEVTLNVGATHAAILNNQVPGSYSGSFTVEVVY